MRDRLPAERDEVRIRTGILPERDDRNGGAEALPEVEGGNGGRMNILAIETATDACSCALECSGKVSLRHTVEPRRHTELLLPMIDAVLAEAGVGFRALDAIAFGRGPGSFTGLRIACAVAQGLGFGADRPLVPVSTLQTVAAGMHRTRGARRVLAAFDARMGEVYWGAFEWDGVAMAAVFDESVGPPDAVRVPDGNGWAGAGPGWSAHRAALHDRLAGRLEDRRDMLDAARLPEAIDMLAPAKAACEAGLVVAPEDAAPVYLRSNVARAAPRRLV